MKPLTVVALLLALPCLSEAQSPVYSAPPVVSDLKAGGTTRLSASTTAITGSLPVEIYTGLTGTATLGTTLVTNGTFTTDASSWTAIGWTWGSARVAHDTGNTSWLYQYITVTSGQMYEVKWTSASRTTGSYTVSLGGAMAHSSASANTTYTTAVVALTSGSVSLAFAPTTDFNGTIDTVSVKLVTPALPHEAVFTSAPNSIIEVRGDYSGASTAFGKGSLRTNYGAYNSAFGSGALYSNAYSASNSAMGTMALYSNTTGSYNSAVGAESLRANTTGNYNSALGLNALYSNTTGNYNSAVGAEALKANTTAQHNTAFGWEALKANTTGFENTAVGAQALKTVQGGQNNTAQGKGALELNLSGNYNTAQGSYALNYNTASNNTAVGASALDNNSTGAGNTAVGKDALGSTSTVASSTAVGAWALATSTVANETAVGAYAAYLVSSGANNTVVGMNAGYTSGATPNSANALTTGSNMTFVGYQSGLGSTSQGTNRTAIGAEAYVTADNTVVLGDENVTSVLASSDGGATVTAGAFKVGNNTGISGTVVVKGSDGNNCNLVFEGGIVTSETCP